MENWSAKDIPQNNDAQILGVLVVSLVVVVFRTRSECVFVRIQSFSMLPYQQRLRMFVVVGVVVVVVVVSDI